MRWWIRGRLRPMREGLVLTALAVALWLPGPTASSPTRVNPPLVGQATIYRDDWGVPHIYAATESAGFYGLGYAQAEDQLESILRLFLIARGELARAVGKDALESDAAARQWMHAEEARAGFSRMSAALQQNYRAYAAGLQQYMTEHPTEVPSWAPHVQPWDPVAVSRAVLWLGYQAGDGLRDCQAGGIKLSAHLTASITDRRQAASNEWVLAPWRTADQASIVLSDPHGGVDGSFVYEFRMHAGSLENAGYAMGAMPLLVHTRYVSWGMTTGAPDVSDCYEVDLDANNPRKYLFDGKPEEMKVRTDTIQLKDAPPVIRTFEYTMHNGVLSPVVARVPGKAYVVSTPYMHTAGVFDEEVYRMNLAHSVGEVREAMKLLGMFPQNIMAGDAAGGSYYVRAGRAPKRPDGFNWTRPVPGNTSRTAWLGIHPLEDLVQIQNPEQGYMQNNNISPDRMMEGSPLTKDRYPTDVFNDVPGRVNSRARRAVDVLSKAYHFTVHDAVDLALDEQWIEVDLWKAALARALRQERSAVVARPPEFRRVADRLLRFDGQARAESMAALNWWYWRDALRPQETAALDSAIFDAPQNQPLPAEVARTLLAALDSSITAMHAAYRTTDLALGEVFRIGRGGHSFPIGGISLAPPDLARCEGLASFERRCVMTLRAFTAGNPDSAGHRWVFLGSRLLRLAIFTTPIQSFTLHNFGQSERPTSPHFVDQTKLSSEHKLKPVYFEKSQLEGHIVSERTLDVPRF